MCRVCIHASMLQHCDDSVTLVVTAFACLFSIQFDVCDTRKRARCVSKSNKMTRVWIVWTFESEGVCSSMLALNEYVLAVRMWVASICDPLMCVASSLQFVFEICSIFMHVCSCRYRFSRNHYVPTDSIWIKIIPSYGWESYTKSNNIYLCNVPSSIWLKEHVMRIGNRNGSVRACDEGEGCT